MKEISIISLSHEANHLTSHFFNQQQQRINEFPANKYLNTILSQNFKSYEPRALVFDVKGGFGSLAKYEFFEKIEEVNEDINNLKLMDHVEVISRPKMTKNQYQRKLDLGETDLNQYLNTSNTEYWTDYSKMIYNPESLVTLANWEYNSKHTVGVKTFDNKSLVFDNYELGVSEWRTMNDQEDVMDSKFRKIIENCDLIDGLNIITSVDSGWSGVSTELIKAMKDEYLPKCTTFVWGLYDNVSNKDIKKTRLISRIKATTELVEESTLYIPLSKVKFSNISEKMLSSINMSSLWHQQYLHSILLDNVGSLFNEGMTMYDFKEVLLDGESKRNIISETRTIIGDSNVTLDHQGNSVFKGQGSHTFGKAMAVREMDQYSPEELSTLTNIEHLREYGTRNISTYEINESFFTSDAAPQIFKGSDRMISEMSISNLPKETLKDYGQYVSKFVRGDEREDLKDKLADLVQEYDYGYSDDEEFD